MNDRFIKIAKHNNWEYFLFNYSNSFEKGYLAAIYWRLKNKQSLIDKIDELIIFLENNDFQNIYLSNLEGYVSLNTIKVAKQRFPHLKYIALQHGVFLLKPIKIGFLVRSINCLIKFFSGIYVVGAGFGGIIVDRYIVYSQIEKDYLIKRKWSKDNIEINLPLLKSYLFSRDLKNIVVEESKDSNTIFLLQSLSFHKLCSVEMERKLIIKTIDYLSKRYNKVYIKEHPMCRDRYFELPNNAIFIDDMVKGFANCSSAYSFFSTALMDAKVFNLKVYAIKSSKIAIDAEIYNLFEKVIDFEDEIEG